MISERITTGRSSNFSTFESISNTAIEFMFHSFGSSRNQLQFTTAARHQNAAYACASTSGQREHLTHVRDRTNVSEGDCSVRDYLVAFEVSAIAI